MAQRGGDAETHGPDGSGWCAVNAEDDAIAERIEWALDCDPLLLRDALLAVQDECERCRRAGVAMAPVVVELLMARALGVEIGGVP